MAKILVVDDDARHLRLTAIALEQAGHEGLSADGGAEGIDGAHAHAPDLVLMDVQMPGMDGVSARARLRAEPRTEALKLVALTALAMKGAAERLLAEDFDGYFEKPIRYNDFGNAGMNGGITLFTRTAGSWRARLPTKDALSRNWTHSPMFREHLPVSEAQTFRQVAMDGVERVAARRKAAEAQRVSIALEVAEDAGRADVDPKAPCYMLDALLDNAIKFNREGGTVAVSARRAGGALEIAVADTGIGIARKDLAKLFKPLTQLCAGLARQHGGVGLGLTLARRLAELHGGTIEVKANPA